MIACEICGLSFRRRYLLLQHKIRAHQEIKMFECSFEGCNAKFTLEEYLRKHIKRVHTDQLPFKCNVCRKRFSDKAAYTQHFRLHTNDRKYKCNLCSQQFFRNSNLVAHKRIHTGERPFPCEVCGKEFRQKGVRDRHLKTQHFF
ncbi:zinc finger and SCAN domain-containing protein 23 [Diorhabda sublineata]|uniref:zinc finger and SCAN domain-containing protein 23 n=1 Tax=Diorhabda sublineata TaxID=1163346 RepID=UPI0024E0C06E|nr:zinc finger and SCAN domain-containing protein 23 [Diorhabda sublineata]